MRFTSLAILIALRVLAPNHGVTQQEDISTLIARLQTADTSDAAVKEIDAGSPDLKSSISDKLPSLMPDEKNNSVLNNEIKLAGDLKAVGCIPFLVTIFVKGDLLPMGLTATMRWHMVDDPAGHALVQIGDPTIPYMNKLLTSNQREDREKAIRVLGNVKSPAAMDVLKEHRDSESDQYLQYVIDKLATPQN